MKSFGIIVMGFCLVMAGCSRQQNLVTVEQGTPAYEFGKALSQRLPFMDPDSNKVLVTSKEFRVSAGEMLNFMKNQFGNRTDEMLQSDDRNLINFVVSSIHGMTDRKLLLSAAKKAGVRVAEEQIQAALDPQIEAAGGETMYKLGLEKAGMNFDYIREDIRTRVTINNYLDRVIEEKSQVNDAEIQKAYEAYKTEELASVRHILLLTQEKTDVEKKQIHSRMEALLKRLRNGEDFAELAKQYSEDPGSKENGGLYENFGRGVMVLPFEQAAFTVPVGEISDIVETQYGYHILKIVDRSTGTKPLEEVRDELVKKLQENEWSSIVPAHLDELKKNAEVQLASFLQ